MRKTERSCNSGFDNTKPKQLAELIRLQGGGLKTKSLSKKSPKKKVSSKKRIPNKHADEYKKLNEIGDITR